MSKQRRHSLLGEQASRPKTNSARPMRLAGGSLVHQGSHYATLAMPLLMSALGAVAIRQSDH